ncbi:MAG: alpha amylase C-terminal domain-containing protein [Phycisphaerales bacterium]|nr:alpha amylase C-terminal domain-containing protein [Phycisphaerales bacterium]
MPIVRSAQSLHPVFAVLAGVGALSSALLAQVDNNVQWSGISHAAIADRRPICPLNGQAFDVIFQTARGDATGARVAIDVGADGIDIAWASATYQSTRGRYDLWRATIPATTQSRIAYAIEVTDGTDSDYLSTLGVSDNLPASNAWWTLDFTTLEHAPFGSTPTASGTVFKVWAPGAASAQVRGPFNSWLGQTMTRQGENFVAIVSNAVAGQKYKYYFNNSLWKPDPRARQIDNADNFNSVIVDPLAYAWRTPTFAPVSRDKWVVYQLHVGSFSGLNDPRGSFTRQGTYREVAARADHLVDLGINAVMLNPINEFPGSSSGGYNPVSMWSFESAYGSPDDLKFMIDELHARGIAVMLDVVWNHFSPSDNFLWNFDSTQVYFDNPVVDTPWGAQANFDRAPVFSYFFDSIELVLGEFRMDGYRQDAVAEIVSATQFTSGQQLIRGMMDRVDNRFADAHVIGEIYNTSPWNTSPAGMNLDGQYHEPFKNGIRDAIFAAAVGTSDISRVASSIDGSGTWVEGERVLNYFELHDDAWPVNAHQRAVKTIDTTAPHDDRYAKGRTKLGNGLTLLSRGMPAILQGNEWLESNGWEVQKIDWAKKTTYSGVFQFYKDLIALRTSDAALAANAPCRVFHVNETQDIMAFERAITTGNSYVCVANFSNTDFAEYLVGLPRAGGWRVVMNSESAAYQGRGVGSPVGCVTVQPVARDGLAQRANLSLPAHGFILLKHDPSICRADFDCTGGGSSGVGTSDIFAFLNAWFASSPQCDIDGVGGVDTQDVFAFLNIWFAGC